MEPLALQQPPKSDPASKRVSRSKTVFQIAQPPPSKKSRSKLRRPRILLQLRQVSENRRPLPVLDVLPSSYFGTRLAHRFPKIFKGKDALGPNDIIVANSDSSGIVPRAGEDAGFSSDDEAADSREVVGTICRQIRKPQKTAVTASAEICLDQGLVWKAKALPRGGYEFNATAVDGSPLQARWVRQDRPHRRISSLPDATSAATQVAKRFTFSIVNPSARRHPVIASMTAESIEVHDQYPAAVPQNKFLLNTPQSAPTSPSSIFSHGTSYFDIEDLISQPKEPLIHTDHHLKSLIVITGIYVSLEEGWVQDATSGQRRTPDLEIDSTSTVESKATIAKLGRAGAQIFHRKSAVLPEGLHVERLSSTFDRANSSMAAYTTSSNQRSLSAPLRRGKEDHETTIANDGVHDLSDVSSRPSSQGLPPYSKTSDSGLLFGVGAKLASDESRFAYANDHADKGSIVPSASTKSSLGSKPKGISARSRVGFRRFFSLPCIGPASAPKPK